MGKYTINLTVLLDAQNPEEVRQKLNALLSNHEWEMGLVQVIEDAVPDPVPAPVSAANKNVEESYITYRVADEKFRTLAKDFGIPGTELKIPKHREFLQFRMKAFLEDLGYKVEPKTNIRVVAESHVDNFRLTEGLDFSQAEAEQEIIYTKKI